MYHAPPKNILLATDLSEASVPAAKWAGLLARRFGSRVFAVHAEHIELPPYFSAEQHDRLRAEAQAARAQATQLLAEFVAPHVGFLPESRIIEGHPVDAIAACARECNADLVVMGTHGRRGMSRLWLGSVAEAVLVEAARVTGPPNPYAERPVLTIHAGTVVAEPREIVLMCEPLDIEANRLATAWAEAFGATLLCRAPDAGPGPAQEVPALLIAAGDHPERGLRKTLQPFMALPRRRPAP